jgi:hypothetical protein
MPVLLTLYTPLKDLNINLRRWGTKLTPAFRVGSPRYPRWQACLT